MKNHYLTLYRIRRISTVFSETNEQPFPQNNRYCLHVCLFFLSGNWLVGLSLFLLLNSYGHVWTVSSPNHTHTHIHSSPPPHTHTLSLTHRSPTPPPYSHSHTHTPSPYIHTRLHPKHMHTPIHTPRTLTIQLIKVRKRAKIRNRYNQAPHLTSVFNEGPFQRLLFMLNMVSFWILVVHSVIVHRWLWRQGKRSII